MPMNEQPPWGRKKKPSAPEDILAQIIQAIRDFFEGQGNGKNRKTEGPGVDKTQPDNTRGDALLAAFVVALVILQLGLSAFFTIAPGEVGVVQRFGRYDRTTEPGLHLKIPYIEQLTKVDVERVRKEEFGFRSSGQGQNSRFDRTNYKMEPLALISSRSGLPGCGGPASRRTTRSGVSTRWWEPPTAFDRSSRLRRRGPSRAGS